MGYAALPGQDGVIRNEGDQLLFSQETSEKVVVLHNGDVLGEIIAREMGANIKISTGPALERAGDLAGILTNLEEGDVLFIDEIKYD